MAQTLKSKVSKLAQAYSITAIIDTAKQVQIEQADIAIWDAMSTDEKTEWFLNQCKKYNLTPLHFETAIYIKEFVNSKEPYFIAWLENCGTGYWHIEIGNSLSNIWPTSPGIKGQEEQIKQVMRLRQMQEYSSNNRLGKLLKEGK